MKITPLLTQITPNFIEDYLGICGILNPDKYLHPDDSCFDNVWNYPNMDKAVKLLHGHIGDKIGILMD